MSVHAVRTSAARSVICVHRQFERSWPYTADHWHGRWLRNGGCDLIRTEANDAALPAAPLLGRHNVVHTPHAAGRTRDANQALADDAIARFRPR